MPENVFRRRLLGAFVAVAVAATVSTVACPAPAEAAWGYTWTHFDNMEPRTTSQPEDRFFFDTDSSRSSGYFAAIDDPNAVHSGLTAAHVYNSLGGGTFSSVGKTVTIAPRSAGYWTTCQFNAWINTGRGEALNIEVIDPVNWTYVTVKRVTASASYTWQQVSTAQFNPPPRPVVLRVSYLFGPFATSTGFATVDDFKLTCTY